MILRPVIPLALVALLTIYPGVRAEQTKGLDIKLISENTTITPGKAFTLGLHIQHHPGYHTYWKNPGVVGLATSIQWQLPPGFKADDIQWPHPEISDMAGHPCHGYERDVTLLIQIHPPQKISQPSITLTAKTRWMCCATNCHPGFKDFTITLPVSNTPQADKKTTPLFTRARKELPKPKPPWKTTLLSKPDQSPIRILLTPRQANTPAPEYLFSSDGQISSDQKQTFTKQPGASYLLTIPRSDFSPKKRPTLPAVIKAGDQHYLIAPNYPK